jgi:hypothetical protein
MSNEKAKPQQGNQQSDALQKHDHRQQEQHSPKENQQLSIHKPRQNKSKQPDSDNPSIVKSEN